MNSIENTTSGKSKNQYTRFVAMLSCSFLAMYITMYLNTYEWDHVWFSLTRFYMVCLGVAAMAIIMFVAMRGTYQNKTKNAAIVLGSIILFTGALILVREQRSTVGDILWMKAMIPHHSIAILTSERADLKDPEVKKLAEEIIRAQEREISEMKAMINRLQEE